MKTLFQFVILATLGLSALLGICIGVGRLLYKPGFLASGDCNQPCWHGIRLGETLPDMALRLLYADHLTSPNIAWPENINRFCWASSDKLLWEGCFNQKGSPRSPISSIDLRPHNNILTLKEVIGFLGSPLAAYSCTVFPGSVSSMTARAGTAKYFYFENDVVVRAYDAHFTFAPVSETTLVYWITWYSELQTVFSLTKLPRWQGFLSLTKLNQCPD